MGELNQAKDGGPPSLPEDTLALIAHMAKYDIESMTNRELITDGEYTERQLLEITNNPDIDLGYREYVTRRARLLQAEITRRVNLYKKGPLTFPTRGFINQDILDEIRRRTSMVDLLGRDIAVFFKGRSWRGACPVHGDGRDRDPSLHIYEDERRWWCFGCNAGGDCFDWMRSFHHMEFKQAVETLASYAGIKIEYPVRKTCGIKRY